jgi:perosamine synthetase
MVSYLGEYVKKFEQSIKSFTNAKHAIAIVNGTCALHIAMICSGVQRNEEVFVPSFTFVATINAISYVGAIPHFIDIDPSHCVICPIKLQEYLEKIAVIKSDGFTYNASTGRKITAIVVMHTFGHPVDLEPISIIAKKYNLVLIEDSAQSLGSFYKGVHTGNFGLVGIFSFNGNKIITTGGGGAIITNDDAIAKKIMHISTTAKKAIPYRFVHDEVGYNYRMPNINAAVGLAQMECLSQILERKRNIAHKYNELFSKIKEITFLIERKESIANYWLNAIILKDATALEEVLKTTNESGIQTRPAWNLMHTLPMYLTCPKSDLSVSEDIASRLINIPS